MSDDSHLLNQDVAIRCPRCSMRLPPVLMARHVWLEHRLVLYGRTVLEPWRLIEDWIEEACRHPAPQLLRHCLELAQHVDPEDGLVRLQRLLLVKGLDDPGTRSALFSRAAVQRASVCPRCFSLVPVPQKVPIRPLSTSRGRVSGNGYRVQVSDHGLFSRLEIETPSAIIYRGAEPDQQLTIKGATLLLAGPPIFLALLLAVELSYFNIPPLLPVLFLLTLALIILMQVRAHWRATVPLLDRAVDYAWSMLVPRCHATGFIPEDAVFLAALALTSAQGHGGPRQRTGTLQKVVNYTEKAVIARVSSSSYLAPLWRLAVEDAAKARLDPIALAVSQVARCLDGKLPMTLAEEYFDRWESEIWARPNLARLRILLCDRAFEAGFEVGNLRELGKVAPALGAVLDTGDMRGLAHFRLLWSLRPSRPWERHGQAATAFELAADPEAGSRHLRRYPDLLLESRDVPGLYLCVRGVYFQGSLFTELPRSIEVKTNRRLLGGGYSVTVGDKPFWFATDPDSLVARLEKWLRYYFLEFVPKVSEVEAWRAPALTGPLPDPTTVQCPGCRQAVVVHLGGMATLAVGGA